MNSARSLVIAVALTLLIGQVTSLSGQVTSAQDLSRYRAYVLESSLDSVVAAASGARADDAKMLHERPATIQELEWQAPYFGSETTSADPVREIVFTFYNGALYQLVVNYDRDRTEGLSNSDVIESVSAAYGAPALAAGRRISPPPEALPDSIVLARWENTEAVLTLVRGAYAPEFQLILTSTSLGTRARSAIREAIRLDAVEAPRREAAQRKKDASDASAARDKTRVTNKEAFRP